MQPDCPSAAGLPLNRIASFEWTDHVADLAWVFASGGDVRPLSCCGSAQKVENNGLGGVAGAGLWCLNDETDRRRNLEISRRGMRGASSREGPGSQLVLGTRVEPLGLKRRQAVNLLSCAGTRCRGCFPPLERIPGRQEGARHFIGPATRPVRFRAAAEQLQLAGRLVQLAIVSSSSSTNLVSAARRELESAGALR